MAECSAGRRRTARRVTRARLGRDASLLIAGQAVRAAGYGFTAVLLEALLAQRGYGPLRAGVVLTALIAGTALASLVVGALADRVGRRRSYAVFFLGVAAVGAVVAAGAPFWLLLVVALTGTLSTDVVDRYRRHGRPRHPVAAPRRAGRLTVRPHR
jgi:MFS family permease